nr:cupin-like domain-containing protein [Geodermatophilaceae bacterium]
VWSRRPLLSQSADLPGRFVDLLSLDDVDELVSRRGLRTPFLRIAKNGQVIDAARFTRSGGAGAQIADQVSDDRVLELFADGCTLVLQGLHRLWPPLIEFASALVTDLGHPVQINAYITPAQSQGFSAHYDVHDVFVLQIAGTKRWVIHPPVLTDPLRSQPWTDRRAEVSRAAEASPEIDAVLKPGDALYLPRGWLHSATAQGEVSAHLTVGIHSLTRYTLVEALLEQAAHDPALRTSLPLGIDPSGPGQLDVEIQATVDRLVAFLPATDPVKAADGVRRQLWSAVRPSPLSPITQAAAAAQLTPATSILRRPHLRHALHVAAEQATVTLADRSLTFPAGNGPALTRALSGPTVLVAELPDLVPEERLVLARRLLLEGLVVTSAVGAGPPG